VQPFHSEGFALSQCIVLQHPLRDLKGGSGTSLGLAQSWSLISATILGETPFVFNPIAIELDMTTIKIQETSLHHNE
jgi:hypothetical protein